MHCSASWEGLAASKRQSRGARYRAYADCDPPCGRVSRRFTSVSVSGVQSRPYLSVAENVMLPCRFSARRLRLAIAGGNRRVTRRACFPSRYRTQPAGAASYRLERGPAAAGNCGATLLGHPEIVIADEPTSPWMPSARPPSSISCCGMRRGWCHAAVRQPRSAARLPLQRNWLAGHQSRAISEGRQREIPVSARRPQRLESPPAGLTLITVALSVTLLLGVERIRRGRRSFAQSVSGTDLIVGARTGQVADAVRGVSHPVGNQQRNAGTAIGQ